MYEGKKIKSLKVGKNIMKKENFGIVLQSEQFELLHPFLGSSFNENLRNLPFDNNFSLLLHFQSNILQPVQCLNNNELMNVIDLFDQFKIKT